MVALEVLLSLELVEMKILANETNLFEMEDLKFGRNKQASSEVLQECVGMLNKPQHNKQQKCMLDNQMRCLEQSCELLSLEDAFGNLTSQMYQQTVKLSKDVCNKNNNNTINISNNNNNHNGNNITNNDKGKPTFLNANNYQNCMLGMKSGWDWLGKLMQCSQTHFKHCSQHHQFMHNVDEMSSWMEMELNKVEGLMEVVQMQKQQQATVNQQLLLEIKTAITILLNWQARVSKLLQQSQQITPIKLRSTTADKLFPAISLVDYVTKNINLREGEEVMVEDNSDKNTWTVSNVEGASFQLPSILLLLVGIDNQAVQAAHKLSLRFLFRWSEVVKKYGKNIILFLCHVLKMWSAQEERMLAGLPPSDKKDISDLLASITTTFCHYWSNYPPYQTLQTRMQTLTNILKLTPDPNYTSGENGHLLVIQTIPLQELLAKYRELWKSWETYKVLLETTSHPEYLLSVTHWDQYHPLDVHSWLKKWQTEMVFDETDSIGMEAGIVKEEEIQVHRSKQTAESSRMYSSLQEENQTFVITGVSHPITGVRISLDEAVALGIINQAEGKYVNPETKECSAIPVAMNKGLILVEKVSVRTSQEQVQDVGIMTITTIRETRPYTLKGVRTSASDHVMSVEEATSKGILEQGKDMCRDGEGGEEMTLSHALDCGLLLVTFKDDTVVEDPEVETKTFQVNSVVDTKTGTKLTFSQALRQGLLRPEDGVYIDEKKGVEMYIGDAIREGLVKAVVLNDESKIGEGVKMIRVGEERLRYFKKKILGPLRAIRAFKK